MLLPAAPALLIPRLLTILAQADLEEHQQDRRAESRGHQGGREYPAGQAVDQGGGGRTCDDERGGRAEREDASPWGHGSTVAR